MKLHMPVSTEHSYCKPLGSLASKTHTELWDWEVTVTHASLENRGADLGEQLCIFVFMYVCVGRGGCWGLGFGCEGVKMECYLFGFSIVS